MNLEQFNFEKYMFFLSFYLDKSFTLNQTRKIHLKNINHLLIYGDYLCLAKEAISLLFTFWTLPIEE
jgi:hypothetical protein